MTMAGDISFFSLCEGRTRTVDVLAVVYERQTSGRAYVLEFLESKRKTAA